MENNDIFVFFPLIQIDGIATKIGI